MFDKVANDVVQKYQAMSCEWLWTQSAQPKSAEEQRGMGLLERMGA